MNLNLPNPLFACLDLSFQILNPLTKRGPLYRQFDKLALDPLQIHIAILKDQ